MYANGFLKRTLGSGRSRFRLLWCWLPLTKSKVSKVIRFTLKQIAFKVSQFKYSGPKSDSNLTPNGNQGLQLDLGQSKKCFWQS